MSKIIIESNPTFANFPNFIEGEEKDSFLNVSEFFSRTIQAEGITTGHPSIFLRLQGCTLLCSFRNPDGSESLCDTTDVWTHGNPYSFSDLFELMEKNDVIEDLKNGHHLILTGGSPLKQQKKLVKFLQLFIVKYEFKPFIEIENEAVLMPNIELVNLVDQWNNSPKLQSSNMKERVRFKPVILSYLSSLNNSWFKFVVSNEQDWEEIKLNFLDTKIIDRSQVILMPTGDNRDDLLKTSPLVAQIAIENNVKFCQREHIILWNKTVSV